MTFGARTRGALAFAERPAMFGALLASVILMAACAPAAVTPPAVTVIDDPATAREAAAQPPEPPPVMFTLVAAGDVLPHTPVVSSATTSAGMDFSPLTEAVKPYIDGADLALCHMEVPVAPAGTAPSGYPMFGAPAQLVTDLAEDGWDGCSTASNHSVDRAKAGITTTLDAFQAAGMGASGTARTEAESAIIQMYTIHAAGGDVVVANISFAYGLNGLSKPSGEQWAVNTFDANAADASPIIEAARQARAQGADVVVASVHCCVEYQTAPTAAQRSVAQQIADSGEVDLYIGHHAHVPQPIELLSGGPGGRGMWTAFGLGNFISNQDASCCVAQSSSGVLLTATFTVDPANGTSVSVEWTGVTVDKSGGHRVYALPEVTSGVGNLSASEIASREAMVTEAVGTQAPERTAPAVKLARGLTVMQRAA